VDRKFVDRINRVQTLIKEGQDQMSTGAWDEAEKRFSEALTLDPYNVVASKELKKLYGKRRIAAEVARQSSRQERLTETREGWTQRTETQRAPEMAQRPATPIRRASNFAISQKLNSINLPTVDFNDASIVDVANFLTTRTRELDPDGIGISVLLKSEAAAAGASPVNLRLTNVPAGEVLRYATNLAGVKYRVEEFAVFIVPLAEPDNTVLISRDFPVRPAFFDVAPTADAGGAAAPRRRTPRAAAAEVGSGGNSVREALESRGVSFAVDGSAAFYNRSTGILTVRNTQDQIDLVEELVTDEANESLQVRVDVRLVEINQTDLEALTVNGALAVNSSFLPPARPTLGAGTVRVETNLQGASGFRSADGINSIINLNPSAGSAANPVNTAPEGNKLGIGGELDGNAFRVLFEALSQKSSADIMTAPSIVVENTQEGTITIAREFYYPTEFDAPQVTPPSGGVNTLVVPAWPTDFQARNVGVVLTVQPRITVDRQRVFLTIKPEVTEFDGFINYGSRVLSGRGDATLVSSGGNFTSEPIPPGTLISNNVINQPVFSVRTVENAQLEIQDGYTMVLGGLIREDISTVEDKVPILGDIPLVGRLFRSKGEQAIKKNLLMFVTVRILRPDGEPFNVNAGAPVAAQAVAR
jgi:general secretion pathway protein D